MSLKEENDHESVCEQNNADNLNSTPNVREPNVVVDFLRTLIREVETENTYELQEMIADMFFRYQYHKQYKKSSDNHRDFDPQTSMKYLFAGWYIYSFLNNGRDRAHEDRAHEGRREEDDNNSSEVVVD